LPCENLAQGQQASLPDLVGKPFPQVLQQNCLLVQKGGAPSDSFRMLHLHDVRNRVAAPRRRVAARQKQMLPDTEIRVESFRHHGSLVCFVCGDTYEVETDAFGDGCMTYWLAMMTERLEEGCDD